MALPVVPVVTASPAAAAPAPGWTGAFTPVVGPPPAPPRRRGIPPGLALATIIAAVPMLMGLVAGLSALVAGQQVSSASDYRWDDGSGSTFSSDFDSLGDAAKGTGAVIAAISAAGLLAAIAMAGGKNAGRVVTALWIVAVSVYLLSQVGESFSEEAAPYYLLIFGPPLVALVGMFTSAANEVFRDT